MKICPFCAEQIQNEAIKCRYCGEFLDGRLRPPGAAVRGGSGPYWGYEYKSQRSLWGLPLIHIARGIDPVTGLPKVARGILAVGNVAVGVIALGGVAVGGLSLGGVSLGVLALGGMAVGGLAFGGMALALYLAGGGMAISAHYAIGGLAVAPHAIDANRADPELLRQLEVWWQRFRGATSDLL